MPIIEPEILMRFGLPITIMVFAALACGCESQQSTPAQGVSTTQPLSASAGTPKHAECLVCKKNADLACIDVAVDAKTPSYDYLGKRYYFCSDECRDKFAKDPQAYIGK
jgi:YHS domain-containing protein